MTLKADFEKDFNSVPSIEFSDHGGYSDKYWIALWAAKWAMERLAVTAESEETYGKCLNAKEIRQLVKSLEE